jgi:RimJ/RimL family protein N-acetyltransferase
MDTVETGRLYLRPWRTTDLRAWAQMCADADVMRYMPEGRPLTEEESSDKLELLKEFQQSHGYGWWVLEDRESGQFVGRAGLTHANSENSAFPGETEIGFSLARPWWGCGLGTEAASACRDYAFDKLGASTVYAITDPRHEASIKVMRRIGMQYAEKLHDRGRLGVKYSTSRDDRHTTSAEEE